MASVTRRRLALFLAFVLVAIFALIWVKPALFGPDVDCGPLDQATCEDAVRGLLEGHESAWADPDNPYRPLIPMPVSRITFTSASPCGAHGFELYWAIPLWGVATFGGLC
jgi:hypothetical protein